MVSSTTKGMTNTDRMTRYATRVWRSYGGELICVRSYTRYESGGSLKDQQEQLTADADECVSQVGSPSQPVHSS